MDKTSYIEAEPERTYDSTLTEHLWHLINIGWSPTSLLIQKYVRENYLEQELELICAIHQKIE